MRPVLVLLKQDAHDQENIASTMHDIIVLPLAILRNVYKERGADGAPWEDEKQGAYQAVL